MNMVGENVRTFRMAKSMSQQTLSNKLEMMDRCVKLEAKYEIVLYELTTEKMKIICDFLMHCEAMSDRLLELACTYMRFPE